MLRDSGYSKAGSIRSLFHTEQYSRTEAKILVHESPIWGDVRQRDSDFHDRLEEAVESDPTER